MNDVLLVPVTTVQPDLVTQTDVVVYVPLASKTAHGIVKIGDGLNITTGGLLSFDRSEVTIKYIAKNGVDIQPDANKRVNIILTKSDVGLNNVDNTADINKPISIAQQEEFDRINGLIKGADKAVAFANYAEMVVALNNKSKDEYSVGQTIFIGTQDVPDVWIYAVENTSEKYNYTTDEEIETTFLDDQTIKVGYYRLSALESKEIDVSNFMTLDTKQTVTGDKNFTGDLRKDGMDVATIDDIHSVTLDGLNFQPDEDGLLYANNRAYYQGRFTYTTQKDPNTPISVYGILELPIKGDDVTIDSDGTHLTIKPDYSNLVDLTNQQTIEGVKLFKEQIGIVNGGNGDINFIKHINNNFLISASDGSNIINIDEQLQKINFYNKPLATEDHVSDNYVSFNKIQDLTDEQKARARENIGAGTGGGGVQGSTIYGDNGDALNIVYLTNDKTNQNENSSPTLSLVNREISDLNDKIDDNVSDLTKSIADVNDRINTVSSEFSDNVEATKTELLNVTKNASRLDSGLITDTLLSDNVAFKNKINTFTENQTINGTLTVQGNIVQNGESYITHAEQVYSKNDYVVLRDGAVGSLGSGYSGFLFKKYDGTNDGHLVVDVNGIARVGDVGDEQPLATREETPLNGGFAKWDSATSKFVTTTNVATDTELNTKVDKYSNLNTITGDSVDLNDLFDYNTDKRWICTTLGQANNCLNKPVENVNGFTLETHFMRKTASPDRTYIQKFEAVTGVYYRTGSQSTSTSAVTWNDWRTIIDNVTDQVVTGNKSFTKPVKHNFTGLDQQSTPSSIQYHISDWYYDKNNVPVGTQQFVLNTSGNLYHEIGVRRDLDNSGSPDTYASISVGIKSDGTTYATAPNPASNSNTNNIATTKWVVDKIEQHIITALNTEV